ncbi:MAG: cobaltochelatase CobT-related protein [Pontibacterium sp.]
MASTETDKKASPRAEKLQQQVEELCGATVRAASGERRFRFRGRRPEVNGQASGIRAPHLQPDLTQDDFRSFRGAADGIALRLKYSDINLHRSRMPKSPVGQVIFELLEQLRVETQVPDNQPGTQANLEHRYRQWCAHFCASKMTESHVGLLVYTIAQVVWSRLSGKPVEESTEGLIEPQRMMLAPHIGTYLAGLRRSRTDQAEFSQNALGIVQVIDELVDALDTGDDKNSKSKAEEDVANFGLILYPDTDSEGEEIGTGQPASGRSLRQLAEQLDSYQVYSRENDRVIEAEKLVLPAQLKKLRQSLDKSIRGQGVNVARLSRDLAMILSAPQRDGWNFGEEEGYLDARRLSKLVTSPDYRQLFRKERYQPHSNCLVTFLLDNSGSMKEHIQPIAMLIEIMSRALEQAGASTEILGYTTRAWQGGKTFKHWRSRGRPANPGRLTELEHIVYKDADTPIKRARQNIAAMLKPHLFREGIDGEALLWAAERMNGRPEARRILIVLSDGCPMETATNQANVPDYLDNHLKQVTAVLEARRDIELYALGFGLDLSPYYSHNLALDLPETLENSVFKDILQMLSKRR